LALTIATTPLDQCTVLSVSGELDLNTAPELSTAVNEMVANGSARLVLDLSTLTFCDSSGLTAFVRANQAVQAAAGRLVLARPTPIVQRVLELTGLVEVLEVAASLESAQVAIDAGDPPRS
jgi:anti-sigma B factor antagonist